MSASKLSDTSRLSNASRLSNTSKLSNATSLERDKLAKIILHMASSAAGIFYFVNSRGYRGEKTENPMDVFWVVSDDERELFSRLAAIEAIDMIKKIDAERKELYPWTVIALCHFLSSAGTCGIWFGGSWKDMAVSGVLALVVASIERSSILSRQERIILEIVGSFFVGLISGMF
jgi:hypothetical protein